MFEWKISAKVTECQGLAVRKSAEYSLLLGLGLPLLTQTINSQILLR